MQRNREVAQLLDNIARLMTIKGDDPYRVRAYANASHAIELEPEDIEVLHRTGRLREIPGVGESLAAKIAEYLETGELASYEDLKREFLVEAPELLELPSVGPSRARMLFDRLGITNLEELREAARAHRLQELPGFGKTLEERIAREADEAA
jgi:DNA polymerase (family X)